MFPGCGCLCKLEMYFGLKKKKKKKSCIYAQQCCRELHLVRFTLWEPWIDFAKQSLSAPRTASVSTHPDINERLWCAALAISQPLVRVFSISARKEGQSTVISPMEMTSSRYRATSVLNSWTICVKIKKNKKKTWGKSHIVKLFTGWPS